MNQCSVCGNKGYYLKLSLEIPKVPVKDGVPVRRIEQKVACNCKLGRLWWEAQVENWKI